MKNLQIGGNSRLLVSCFVLSTFLLTNAHGQAKVTTFAGGSALALQNPQGGALDSKSNLYVADYFNHRLRQMSSKGVIGTAAGTGIAGFSGDNGPAKSAMVSFPADVVIDSKGDILFSDSGNNRIRKISTTGIITTIVGTGLAGFSGDGGPATSAEINRPLGLALDSAGQLYLSDAGNQRVRKVDTAGNIHTIAGNGLAGFSGDGGAATSASLDNPFGLVLDSKGNLYIADHLNRRVRMVNTTGIINTVVGNGTGGCAGDGGLATKASLGHPDGLRISGGKLLVSNACEARIRAVNLKTHIINTVVGSSKGFDGNSHTALASMFLNPAGLSVDKSGNLLVVDSGNDQVRKLTASTQIVSKFAGGFTGDGGKSTASSLDGPENIAFDKAGNLYIAETKANRIRKVTTTGTISTFAGSAAGVSGYAGDGGAATSATLYFPYGVAADTSGNVFIADTANGVIRKVNSSGTISTFAQSANFFFLTSMATDSTGNLFVSDFGACVVWEISPAGSISLVAGVLNNCGFNSDGIPATQALLNLPYGVMVDSKGNLYIADQFNNRVRRVDTKGVIHTIAGNGTCGFSGDGGPATKAMLCIPDGLAKDSKDNLYIADYLNSRVRLVNGSGVISTFAGTGNFGYNGNGLLATQTNVDAPAAMAVSPTNIVYVDDDVQYRVRKIH
jgi:sugar lactone lactonase YvrE